MFLSAVWQVGVVWVVSPLQLAMLCEQWRGLGVDRLQRVVGVGAVDRAERQLRALEAGGALMPLLEGKTGLIFGVANKRSIAWAIAQALLERESLDGVEIRRIIAGLPLAMKSATTLEISVISRSAWLKQS